MVVVVEAVVTAAVVVVAVVVAVVVVVVVVVVVIVIVVVVVVVLGTAYVPALLQPVELDHGLVEGDLHGLAQGRLVHALGGLELAADLCFQCLHQTCSQRWGRVTLTITNMHTTDNNVCVQ